MQYPAWTRDVIWRLDEETGKRDFIRSRYKIFYGGRASSKSWTAAQTLIDLADGIGIRVLCSREIQKSIKDSSKKLLEDTIKRAGLQDRFTVTLSEIRNDVTGALFVFHGLKDTDSIKSMEGIDICWIEEGETVSQDSIDDVFPTIRKAGSEIWVTFNPKSEESPIYQMFIVSDPPERSIVKKVNYTDNPFCTEESKAEADHCKKYYPQKYKHVWEGFPKQISGDYTVLPIEMLRRCVDAHLELGNDGGTPSSGLDLAPSEESAGDANSLAIRRGPVLNYVEEWKCGDIEKISSQTGVAVKVTGADSVVFDAVGVGGFAEPPLKRHCKGASIIPFMGGGAVFKPDETRISSDGRRVKNKDFFSNPKAQQWWNLRDRMENTIAMLDGHLVDDRSFYLSFDSSIQDLDGLLREMSQATYDYDLSKRIKIDKAPSDKFIMVDGKKKKVKSPNRSDAVGYAFADDFCRQAGYGLLMC